MTNARERDLKERRGVLEAPRSLARLASVQALYQMDLTQVDLNEVISEFISHRFAGDAGRDNYPNADHTLFTKIVRGVVARQREIDTLVNQHLAEGWRLERIDSILRAILRSGTFELLALADIPARVAINEYIEIARAFLDKQEAKVVNGLLDRVARRLRANEFERPQGV